MTDTDFYYIIIENYEEIIINFDYFDYSKNKI